MCRQPIHELLRGIFPIELRGRTSLWSLSRYQQYQDRERRSWFPTGQGILWLWHAHQDARHDWRCTTALKWAASTAKNDSRLIDVNGARPRAPRSRAFRQAFEKACIYVS